MKKNLIKTIEDKIKESNCEKKVSILILLMHEVMTTNEKAFLLDIKSFMKEELFI